MGSLGSQSDYIELLMAMNEARFAREHASAASRSPDETELLRQSRAAALAIAAQSPRPRLMTTETRRMTAH